MPPSPNRTPDFFVDRTRRMLEYADEARDFVRRAAAWRETGESDAAAVCRLWALADELDSTVCETLTAFGDALFGARFELDITRGVEVEPEPPPMMEPRAVYTCAWTAKLGEDIWASVVLSAAASGSERLEARDSGGGFYPLPFPPEGAAELSEVLSDAFFGALARARADMRGI